MSTHTPGPWGFYPFDFLIPSDLAPQFTVGPEEFHTVAQVRPGCEDDDLPSQTEANARLIAAAPELLEALDRIATIYENPEPPSMHELSSRAYDMRCIARSAIAKAKEVAV